MNYSERRWLEAHNLLSSPESRAQIAWEDLVELRRMNAPSWMIDSAQAEYEELLQQLNPASMTHGS
jgi:hypothetical protein